MSSRCRICVREMPKDRKGWEQVCPPCRKEGYKELLDPSYNFDKEWFLRAAQHRPGRSDLELGEGY